MKNKIIFIIIIILVFMILLVPLKGSYAFYSANKDLEVINTRVGNWKSTIDYLRMNDKSNNLSPTTQGDMYRYQGTNGVSNWICFGTTDNCGTNDKDIDKYMYRIIGITKEGELKLLKETFIKEIDETGFAWNDESRIDSGIELCPNGTCPEWNDADLFYRINGTANGTIVGSGNNNDDIDNNTDIFVDSNYYDYLKSGDSYNGTKDEKGSSWYQLMSDHDWMYGDTMISSKLGDIDQYNGSVLYSIETGQKETNHHIQDPIGSTSVKAQNYKWPETNKVTAKVSLMYLHDIAYAYPGGNAETAENVKNSWIFFQKDGYNSTNNLDFAAEWLSTRWGINGADKFQVIAREVYSDGSLHHANSFHFRLGIRPVFYLNSDVNIKYGTGTKNDPFIINL